MEANEAIEYRVSEAVQYIQSNPDAKIAAVAREFRVPRMRLKRRVDGIPAKTGSRAANTKLTEPEEKAICRYIDRLDRINLAVRPEFIMDVANGILQARASSREPALTVNRRWVTRFLNRWGYQKRRQKQLSSNRQASEDVDRVNSYFQLLQQTIQDNGIPPECIWNMDETGFRIGIGKDQLVVTKRTRAQYFALPENRESATAIEAISAAGLVIPAFIILAGSVHMTQWYTLEELDPETSLQLSPTGYSSDLISLNWLKHFEKHSSKSATAAKRLLILDGHGSHHTQDFIQYCDDHGIIPFGLPPHLTHILQPLDVVVFQPLKHYHAKALDLMVRDGLVNITKIEFLASIQGVRTQAFKESTIKSAFRKTGIYPYNPQPVLQLLRDREAQQTPPPRSNHSSSNFNTPVTLRQMNKSAGKVTETLQQLDGLIGEDDSQRIDQFIRGAISLATELVQTKRDLARTRYAEQVARQRRASRNQQLQTGGVLTVHEGRRIIQQREEDSLVKARRLVEAADAKERSARRKWYKAAAKVARDWRLNGRLQRCEVIDASLGKRWLRARF